jgi:TolB-like protein
VEPVVIHSSTDGAVPREPEVVRALRAVLVSSAFAASRRSREFLSYVVTEQLAGRGELLSERSVGRRAMGRDASFDGRHDASVRVAATRVRAALSAYYLGAGALDPVRIELPTGRYSPVFVRTGEYRREENPLGSGLVVVHFDVSEAQRARLTGTAVVEALVQRLLNFGDLQVVGPVTTRLEDPRDIARTYGVRFVVQGSVAAREDAVRLTVRLVDGSSGTTAWTRTSTSAEGPAFDLEDQWAAELAAQLGDSAGVLRHYELDHPGLLAGSSSQAALRAFYACQQMETVESVAVAVEALDGAVRDGDRSSFMLALRAWVGVAAVSYGVAEASELDTCEALAKEAAATLPPTALAQVALGMVALLRGDHDLAGRYGHEAAARAPHHPTALLAAGTLTCRAGDWKVGEAYAREAFRLNPSHPGQHRWLLALARLIDDDPAGALTEASLVHAPGQLWSHLYRAMALSGVGHVEHARREMALVLDLDPTFVDDPLGYFRAGMVLTPEIEQRLSHYLEPLCGADGPSGGQKRPFVAQA